MSPSSPGDTKATVSLTVIPDQTALRVPPVFNLYKAFDSTALHPYMEVFGITFKRFPLPAPSEPISVHIIRTHEYIKAEWCSKNAKAKKVT